ncbi:TonB-dependent receptor [Pseudoduganella umbonata]|uniref:Iron complex outermembrane receptor protein n=1 Tax=Pseudoduganella umbonata TaxID=864828 RepID=A0A4P8HWZ5_9BURK|nr:TonB-dependent receptor [Pseudoduganella umbonata]MBB3222888.1 iron complex outermembrane receptor protein [Pseudoduganella umbonata]QCP13014.1 TonB-dependent receptor [Pseudoduganella umbonata]
MKRQHNKKKHRNIHAGVAIGLLLGARLAGAAEPAPEAAPAPEPAAQGEAVIASVTVTATRRSASLQSVPVAVSVVSGEQLELANRTSIDTVVQEIPSAAFRQQGGNKDSTLFVRGIGTISTSPGVEPTVSTVVDGVVYARPGQATIDLLDIDRIEVLRGPQGTLFGKNASSGVLNIVSRTPSEQLTGYVDASAYTGHEKRVRAGISGALQPGVLRASINAAYADYDGNIENVHAGGGQVNGYERRGVRGRLDITPNADTDISLIADYLKSESSPTQAPYRQTSAPFAQALLPVVAGTENRQVNVDLPNAIDDTNKGVSAQVNWRRNGYTLTSITAWRAWDNAQHTTTSPIGNSAEVARITSAYPATRDIGTLEFTQASQELRLASPRIALSSAGASSIDYVAGLFYLHGKDRETYQRIVTTAATNSGRADYGVESDSYSAFGEGTLHISPSWRAIAGARWTRDKLSYDHVRTSTQATAFPGVQPGTRSDGSTDEDGWSGRLGLQHDFSPAVTAYGTWSRGYKGPAYNVFFNMLARDTLALAPETSSSFELGVKTSAFNRRLTANVALFHTDYSNYQANFYDTVAGAVVTRLVNAGDVSTRGVELDVTARPTPQLTLTGAFAWTDAQVDAFNCPPAAAASCNLNGKTLPFAPRFKGFLRGAYHVPLASGHEVNLNLDYTYQSRTQFDLFQSPDAIQPGYGIVNAAIELAQPAAGWRVALVGKNLADKSYATNLVTGTGTVHRGVPRDDSRYFGITARKEF